MTRYSWPRDFLKSPDRLLFRREFSFGLREPGEPFFDMSGLDLLNELMRLRTFPAQTWLPIGPSILLNGQATGTPMVAGRVRDLCVNTAGTRAYAGTANGGVWYWEQSHGAWRPVGSWGIQPGLLNAGDRAKLSLTIGALLVRFGETGGSDDPTKDVVHVGTGELRPDLVSRPGKKHAGIGVLRLEGRIGDIVDDPGGNPWAREANNLTGLGIFRLTCDPGNPPQVNAATAATLVAATSNGLFFRSGAFSADADWTEVDKTALGFGADEEVVFTDAHWHATTGLWVTAVSGGSNDGLFRAPTGPTGSFTRVVLPQLYQAASSFGWWERQALAFPDGVNDRFYVLGKRTGAGVGHAGLWRVEVAGATAAAKLVDRVPRGVFSNSVTRSGGQISIASDQARYDMAVTAVANTPAAGQDTVFVGGSTQQPPAGGWDASLFELVVQSDGSSGYRADFTAANETTPGQDPTYRGQRIHADVHKLANRSNGLWVACDGGVFRRPAAGGNAVPLNVGLAVLEAGYMSNHPVLDGAVIAGLQDNAVIQRTGDTVWYRRTGGDGGGVGYHPHQPRKFFDQYTNADWSFRQSTTETGRPNLDGAMSAPPFAADENNSRRAEFYSGAAVAPGPSITNGTPPVTAQGAQVCIGTDRLWYCDNWGDPGGSAAIRWVTIPSNSAPSGSTAATADRFERVFQVRFARPGTEHTYGDGTKGMTGTRLLVLTARRVRQFTYTAQATRAASTWTALDAAQITGDHPKEKYARDDVAAPFLDYLPRPADLAWTDVAPHSGTRGSCYVTTTGKTTAPTGGGAPQMVDRYDTLWWYDGAGRWYPTGLLTTPVVPASGTGGARASAHSVIVDPEGVPDFTSQASMTDANRFDFVYVGTRLGVWRGRLTFTPNPGHAGDASQPEWIPAWRWEPYFDGLPQAVVEDLAFHIENRPNPDGGTKKIKLLRAAIVSRGVWELDLSPGADSVGRTFLRSYGLDSGRRPIAVLANDPYSGSGIADPHAASPDIAAADRMIHDMFNSNWAATLPNEADLADLPRGIGLSRTTPGPDSANIGYVMVHHRQIEPMDASDITVHLFAWKNPPYPSAASPTPTPLQSLPLTAAMRSAILGTVEGSSPAMPADLLFLGSGNPAGKVDARMPRPVKFEFDLDYPFDGSRTADTVILIAVVDSPANRLQASDLAHPNLVEVTRRTSLVAVARFPRS